MKTEAIRVGHFRVIGLRDGLFSLDGGAMFGVVPKILWARKFPADDQNRITLALNSFLIRTPEALVLVETGMGQEPGDHLSQLYRVVHDPGLLPSLAGLGFAPQDVDIVVNTHLHFDHCTGNTRTSEEAVRKPTFPRAKYVIQKGEWEAALHPGERDKTSYIRDNFLPLEGAGALWLAEGDTNLCPGVSVILTPGHTLHHQGVKVESQGKVLFILGDLVPTTAHVRTSYVMSYDLYPLQTMATKKKVYEEGLAGGWLFGFVHDPVHYFGRVAKAEGKYDFRPVTETTA
jgi:glyoxylase-like metal-dependent hydrolase (beta-lactamase superfamily II)